MKIGGVVCERVGDRVRLQTAIEFEATPRAPIEVFFEIDATRRPAPGRLVEPFLPVAAVVADRTGEGRVHVADPVDPALVSGIHGALLLQRAWWPLSHERLHIEATPRVPVVRPHRTASCLTGGVDSSALLIRNQRDHPPGHPHRVEVGMVVYGLDASTDGDILDPDGFLREVAGDTGIEIAAVRTNIRDLDPTTHAWHDLIQAATFAGAAHAALPDCDRLIIPPGDALASNIPYGTHPALDHQFGSAELRVQHEIVGHDRLERLQMVVASPLLDSLQVCNRPRVEWGATRNCGRCEKCLRTTVGLRAAGVDQAVAFSEQATAVAIDRLDIPASMPDQWDLYLDPLRARGDDDLADAAQRFIRRVRRREYAQRAKSAARRLLSARSNR